MKVRGIVRTHYLVKALLWAILAIVCTTPALPYLRAFAKFVREGLNGGF